MLNLMSFSPSNFGRYASQSEHLMDESSNGINERTQIQQKPTTTNNIPSLMSLSMNSPPTMTTTTNQQKSTLSASVIKENIEPLPFPQHGPGPIQRPNKLQCSPTTQASTFFTELPQSSSTPDVLVQINHLLDHQNSIATIPSTLTNSNSTNSSSIINDISTPNGPWTPFSPAEWPPKYDTSWPMTNIQGSNVTQTQNPFVRQQISTEDSSVWPSALGSTASRSTLSNTHIQRTPGWNELSSNETTKSINDAWSKFLPISEPSSTDSLTPNKPENETNNPLWNSINLNEMQQNSSTIWWTKTPSDENNNDNDQSRWDFAR